MEKTAVLSACGQYRYALTRRWGDGQAVLYIMLNPSTADASIDDPTIVRCVERARRLGYNAIEVVNLFALRSTDPKGLYKHPDPIGPDNATHLVKSVLRAGIVICAWGAHAEKVRAGRAAAVVKMIREAGRSPCALALTKDGQPRHPLYVALDVKPMPIEE